MRRSQFRTCARDSIDPILRCNSRKTSCATSSATGRSCRQCQATLYTMAWCSRTRSPNSMGASAGGFCASASKVDSTIGRLHCVNTNAGGESPNFFSRTQSPHPPSRACVIIHPWEPPRPLMDVKKKLQDEIAALDHELKVELPREILKARAHGDLSENAEYHAAKDRQGFVNARLNQLKQRLAELSMIDFSKIPHDRAGLGSTVVVLDTRREEEFTYDLVTSEEADASNGKISTTSPIGRAILGKMVGDTVGVQSPGGVKELEILKLITIHDKIE